MPNNAGFFLKSCICVWGLITALIASSERSIEGHYAQLRCIHMPSIHAKKGGVLLLNVPMSLTSESVTLAQFVRGILLEQGKISSAPARIHIFLYTWDVNKVLRGLTSDERAAFWSRVTNRDQGLRRSKDLSRLPISFADVLSDYFLILHIEESVSKL